MVRKYVYLRLLNQSALTQCLSGTDCSVCGTQKLRIREEISEYLEFVPASLIVKQFVRPRAAAGSLDKRKE